MVFSHHMSIKVMTSEYHNSVRVFSFFFQSLAHI